MRRTRLAVGLALVAILIPIGLLMATATTASAAPTRPSTSALICSKTTPAAATTSATNYLPMNRWAGAVSTQHERQSGGGLLGVNIGGTINGLERTIYIGFPTELASSMWRLGGGAVTLANNFCFSTSVGGKANQLAATIGNAFTGAGAPILVIIVVIAIIAALWGASRGRTKSWGQLIRVLVIVGIFAAIVGAASTSTPTNPSVGSPEWLINHVYTAVAGVANAPAQAVTGALVGATGSATTSTPAAKTDVLACSHYDSALIDKYQHAYAGKLSDAVPMALNSLWMESVLPAYSEMALGGSNPYAPLVSCHLLEDQSGIPASTQLTIENQSLAGVKFPASQSASAAFYTGAGDSTTVDRSMIAWAACQSTAAAPLTPAEFTLMTGVQITPSAWTQVADPTQTNGGTKITPGDCALWWGAKVTRTATTTGTNTGHQVVGATTGKTAPPNAEFLPSHSPFNYGGTQGKVADATGKLSTTKAGSGLLNFILTLHGETNTVGIATALVLLLASFSIMVVFLVLAVALLIAKLSLLIAILLLPLMLLLAAFPGSASSKLPGYLKHTLSLIIFATCAALLLSVIALVTELVAGLGIAIAGPGSVIAILWIAIAPLAAVFAIHHFFRKVLKAPSPFKPSAALAYGAAAGGFAGAGVASLGDRAMGMGRKLANTARSRMGGGGSSSGGGSRRGSRVGGMEPGGDNKTSSTKGRGAPSRSTSGTPKGGPATPGEQDRADAWHRTQVSAEERRLRDAGVAPKAAAAAAVATFGAAAADRSSRLRRAAGVVRGHPKQVQRGRVRRVVRYGSIGAAGALMLAAGPVGAVALAGVGLHQATKRYGPTAHRRSQAMKDSRQQEANSRLEAFRSSNDTRSSGSANKTKRGTSHTRARRHYDRTPRSSTMDTGAPAPEATPPEATPPETS